DKIIHLEKKLKKLEKVPPSSERPKQVKPEKSLSSTKVETEKTPSPVPPKEASTPDSGTIVEEDLQQKTPS
ncbi:MAG: hypothetical protein JRF45_13535, partial [Deltaproteobacteria bacterium]|nr:hypothetical protein [Deltaproteobacteria bacterium]